MLHLLVSAIADGAAASTVDPAAAAWVQAGGFVAFASAVYLELRKQRGVLESLRDDIHAMLERDRMRGETPPHGIRIRP